MSNIPDSIKEASPHNFSISKNDINDPQQDTDVCEGYVRKIILDWVHSITSELLRNKHPEEWERYPEAFMKAVVMANPLFPSSLPVGFVLVCFIRSVYPRLYKRPDIQEVFNRWISTGDVRKQLFKYNRRGDFYIEPMEINVEDPPDGLDLSNRMYETSQGDMFNSAE